MATETLSGSITLKRLKKGVSVILSIECENGALYQGYNDKTGMPLPDFTVAANQPILVPKVVAGNGQSASITNGSWYYNGTLLVASATATSEGFYKCTDARFAINSGNHKLRIIGNVASEGNVSNDLFTFKCSGEVGGTDYNSEATAELHLQKIGSSAAALYVSGGCTLSESIPTVPLTANLFIDGSLITSGYTYRFYDEGNKTLQESTSRTYTVKRDDVTAIGGIYCSAYKTGDSKKTIIATDFHKMTDIGDEYELAATVDKEWNGSDEQTVTAHLYKFTNGAVGDEVTMTSSKVKHQFVSSEKRTSLGTATGTSVKVGSAIWGKITDNSEDVVDLISYEL